MFAAILTVAIVLALLLVLIILIQNPKGGGLSSQFSGVSNQVFGAKQSAEGIEKITWYLGIGLMVLCVVSSIMLKNVTPANTGGAVDEQKSKIEQPMNDNAGSTTSPVNAPAPPPAQ